MNRRDTFLALLAIAAAPARSNAQSSGKVARIGLLGVTSAADYAPQVEATRQGFRDLGYVEGRNLVIEYRWADSRQDRLPALAAELVRLRSDVIVTSGVGTRALKEATTMAPGPRTTLRAAACWSTASISLSSGGELRFSSTGS